MNKELTPLEALGRIGNLWVDVLDDDYKEITVNISELPSFNIVKTALNKLEGLEKVYKVAKDYEEELTKDRDYWRDKAYKKQLKALEIIKEKRVNVFWLMECISCYTNALEKYNEEVLDKDMDCLTQEEFDLLKEVLL